MSLTGTDAGGEPLGLTTAAFRLTYDKRSVGAGASDGGAGEQVLLITALDDALPSAGEVPWRAKRHADAAPP